MLGDSGFAAEPPVWSPDSRHIYHRALVDGAIGIWETAMDGSGSRPVVLGDADVESLHASEDGSALIYVTGPTRGEIVRAEQREYDEGILVDASVDLAQNLYRGGFVLGRLASQRLVGRWYQRDGLLWRAPRTRHRLDLPGLDPAGAEALPPPGIVPLMVDEASGGLEARSASGNVARAAMSGGQAMLEVRRSGGGKLLCAAPACRSGRVVALAWRPGQDALLFTTEDRHFRQSLHVWRPGTGHVARLVEGEGQLSGGRSGSLPCALAVHAAVCGAGAAASPPRLERIDFESGARQVLHDPNQAIRARTAPRVEHVSWHLADGRLATGTLLTSPGRQPERAPLFVTYYRCPGYLRGGVGDEFPLAPLAGAGFVVACLNMVPFETWGDGVDRYRAAQVSVEGLVALLDRRGWIDRARIGMGGFSAGSEATMWIAVHTGLLAAAALASPQYEPAAYWLGAIRGRDNPRVMREFLQVGAPDEDPERWRLIAPALNVAHINAPLLMQFPEQEARSAVELYARLSNSTTPVEMYAFPHEGHMKIQPRHRLAVYRRNLDWFRFWLQDHVDPDPARAGQYRRWDALRRRREGSALNE
jgi:hypothetical protein